MNCKNTIFTISLLLLSIPLTIVNGEGNNSGGGPPNNPKTQCVTQLAPCQPFLTSKTTPPATCCLPLKEMITNEVQCLCGVINDPGVLQAFNATKDDAINLAKFCGANPDTSVCKTTAAAPSASSPTASNSSSTTTTASPPSTTSSKSTSSKFPNFEGKSAFFAFFVALFVFIN